MGFVKERLSEPSTFAGIGILFSAIAALVSSHGADLSAWGTLATSIAAIFMPEKS